MKPSRVEVPLVLALLVLVAFLCFLIGVLLILEQENADEARCEAQAEYIRELELSAEEEQGRVDDEEAYFDLGYDSGWSAGFVVGQRHMGTLCRCVCPTDEERMMEEQQ